MTTYTWTLQATPTGNFSRAAWSPDLARAVVVGSAHIPDEAAIYSDDGVTWLNITAGSGMATNAGGIVWSAGLGLFVALYNANVSSDQIYTSPDGDNFTGQGTPFGSAATRLGTGLAWGESLGLLVATTVGGSAPTKRIWTSPDATTWTNRTNPLDNTIGNPCFSDDLGMFAVAGSDVGLTRAIATSTDGTTWTAVSTPLDGGLGVSVMWSSLFSRFIAMGSAPTTWASSSDGVSWAPLSTAPTGTGNWGVDSYDRIVSVTGGASHQTIWESLDGDNFSLSGPDPFAISSSASRWVIWADSLGATGTPIIVGFGGTLEDAIAIPAAAFVPQIYRIL